MTKQPKSVGAEVRAQLVRLARERGDDVQSLFTRYANERFLYRLSKSQYANQFVLKGATLFALWTGHPHRATRDVDLLGSGDPTEGAIRKTLTRILSQPVVEDGVEFRTESLKVESIREGQVYGGMRGVVVARLTTAKVRIQIDIGFGDAITPEAQLTKVKGLLDFPAPHLRVYPRETVVAEKLEAMVQLGMANSRMKDFYDLAILARHFEFDGSILVQAIRATFERRQTPLPKGLPTALSGAFAFDKEKVVQWKAFARKALIAEPGSLSDTVETVRQFVETPLGVALSDGSLPNTWRMQSGWN